MDGAGWMDDLRLINTDDRYGELPSNWLEPFHVKKLRGQDHSLGVTSLSVHGSVVTANVRTMHSSDELISQNIRACCADNIKILSFASHGKVIFELAQEVHFRKRNEKRKAVSAFFDL